LSYERLNLLDATKYTPRYHNSCTHSNLAQAEVTMLAHFAWFTSRCKYHHAYNAVHVGRQNSPTTCQAGRMTDDMFVYRYNVFLLYLLLLLDVISYLYSDWSNANSSNHCLLPRWTLLGTISSDIAERYWDLM